MKAFAILSFFIALILIVTPLISIKSSFNLDNQIATISEKIDSKKGQAKDNPKDKKDDKVIKVLLSDGTVKTLSEFDYVCGTIACEMPPTYHKEALKAQAIACYTFAVKARQDQANNPNPDLKGAYLTSDSNIHQGYKTKEQLKEKWGNKYDTYYKKIEECVKPVLGKIITYNGEIITAAYHAISSGKTEDSSVVWGKEIPYLVSVNSPGDKLSPNYSSTIVYNKEQFLELSKALKDTTFSEDASTWVSSINKSKNGTVTSIIIGGKTFSGTEVRNAFKLRSSCFNVDFKNDNFTFNVVGYGHCVGLSQYGADYMSRQGSNYKEILMHYYKGIEVK